MKLKIKAKVYPKNVKNMMNILERENFEEIQKWKNNKNTKNRFRDVLLIEDEYEESCNWESKEKLRLLIVTTTQEAK